MAVGVACVLCLYSVLGVFLALYKFVCVCAHNNLKKITVRVRLGWKPGFPHSA